MYKIIKNEFGEDIEIKVKPSSNLQISTDPDLIKPFEKSVDATLNDYKNCDVDITLMLGNITPIISQMLVDYDLDLITEAGIHAKLKVAIPKIKKAYDNLVEKQNENIEVLNKRLEGLLKTDLKSVKNYAINNKPDSDKLKHINGLISYLPDDILLDLYHNSFTYNITEAATWYHALMIRGNRDIANNQPTMPLKINTSNGYLEYGLNTFNSFDDFLSYVGIVRDFKNLNQYTLKGM